MSLFHILHLSSRALQGQQAGLHVTANNVANATTPGYHRQAVDFRTVGSQLDGQLLLGRGVTAAQITSAYDRFTEGRLLQEHGHQAYASEMSGAYQALEALVGQVGDHSLGARLDRLYAAFDAMAASPWDATVREQVLDAAEGLVGEFHRQAEALEAVALAADEALATSADGASELLAEIAALNTQIVTMESGGQTANDLRDERARLADDLASLVDITVDEPADGSWTVLVGGHAAVQGGEARTLAAVSDPVTGVRRLALQADGVPVDIHDQIVSGSLRAHIQVRDEAVPGLLAELDQLAYDLMVGVNAVHQTGYGLDGNTGRDLFTAPTQVDGAATAIELDMMVAGQPDALAAALDPAGLPGDGAGAAALGDLAQALLSGGGTQTLTQAMSDLTGEIASSAAAVNAEFALQSAITSSVEAMWAERAAVSLEEEAVNLIKYQDAYEAMTRVLQVTQQMLDTLMEIR